MTEDDYTAVEDNKIDVKWVFIILIVLGGAFVYKIMMQEMRIKGLQEQNNQWQLVTSQQEINFENCSSVQLYIKINETGTCSQAMNQLDFTRFKKILNMCSQDVLLRCGE
jgi:hypothetical protein